MKLIRQYDTGDKFGTFGKLYSSDDNFICHTIERGYFSNQRFISSVPPGEYKLESHSSNKYGETVALVNKDLNVSHYKDGDGRYAILIHSANNADQLQGCIAPGLDLGVVNNQWAVINSREALKRLKTYFENDDKLEII